MIWVRVAALALSIASIVLASYSVRRTNRMLETIDELERQQRRYLIKMSRPPVELMDDNE